MPNQLRVKGHTLRYEGRIPNSWRYGDGCGPAICSCGWSTEPLDSTAARQRAHRAHKWALLHPEGRTT